MLFRSGGEKPKVLVMIDWYLPGFKAGGPIQSVANMVSQLKDNIDFRIITTDTDLFSDQPYANIKSDSWNTLDDGTEVYYLSGKNLNYKSIKNLISQLSFDAVYLNSFFSKYFTLYPLLILNREISTAKLIVAPRGMMGKGSLQLKAFKKKIFITLSKITGLYKNVHWHASSEIEKSEIENVFGRSVEITIARNLSPKMEVSHHEIKKLTGECRFVFLSRIARVKNLVYAIEMLGKIGRAHV